MLRPACPPLLLLALLLPLPAAADEVEALLGRFESEIFDGSELLPAATRFLRGGEAVVGRYMFVYRGRREFGRLEDCRLVAERSLECRWSDVFGSGTFEAIFHADGGGFEGRWAAGRLLPELSWRGRRVECPEPRDADVERDVEEALACAL